MSLEERQWGGDLCFTDLYKAFGAVNKYNVSALSIVDRANPSDRVRDYTQLSQRSAGAY